MPVRCPGTEPTARERKIWRAGAGDRGLPIRLLHPLRSRGDQLGSSSPAISSKTA